MHPFVTDVVLADPAPAGGAALAEVVWATTVVGLVTLGLALVAWAHRTRRTSVLVRIGAVAERQTGLPAWAALPTALSALSLLTALFGMLWDISLHIGRGRDAGPLANPAHYFILVGLYLLFVSGMFAVVLPLGDDDPGPASVRIWKGWRAPVGGVLIAASGGYALLGFPLDDIWHRLFGQDVTLWGPTHLMLITGAGLSLVGVLTLEQEGRAVARGTGTHRHDVLSWLRRSSALGGLLLGLSVFQAEFDFGVPQFRMVLQPLMIAGAAAMALVAARLHNGRGSALGAVAFFLVIRSVISVIVGPLLGEPLPSFPLYLAEGLFVEAVGLTALVRRPLAFGAVSGLLIGTVGMATEAVWTHYRFVLPWTADISLEALLMAAPVAVGLGMVGAMLPLGLRGRLPRPAVSRTVVTAAVLVLAAAVANGLVATVPEGASATITLSPAPSDGGGRMALVAVDVHPASLVDDDDAWVQMTAWQGNGLVVDRLRRTGPGTFVSTEPVPVYGSWKTLLRLHNGRMLAAVPLYLPADPAIPAEELPAVGEATRPVQAEQSILQRERKQGVAGWLWGAASLVVLVCSLALIAALSWGVGRLNKVLQPPAADPDGGVGDPELGDAEGVGRRRPLAVTPA